jgi:hypothetical protein
MTVNGLQRRIAQLEEASLPPEPKYVQIIVDEGETEGESPLHCRPSGRTGPNGLDRDTDRVPGAPRSKL